MKRIETLSRVFRYIASVAISVVAGMVVLSELGISIAPILATAGMLGVAVGFGAQSLIKDYFNGFFLLLENQVRQGDVVEAGDKSGLIEIPYPHLTVYAGQAKDGSRLLCTSSSPAESHKAYADRSARAPLSSNFPDALRICTEGHEIAAGCC